jgi:hypothetical protein
MVSGYLAFFRGTFPDHGQCKWTEFVDRCDYIFITTGILES